MFNKYRIFIILVSALGFAAIMLSTHNYGAGLSPDSVEYIAIARNINAGNGIVFHDGAPLLVWPPMYPALLALLGRVMGRDPSSFAHIVNAIIFGLIIYFSGQLYFNSFSSFPLFAFAGMLAVLVSTQLFKVVVMAWSEPLFILFVVVCILFANSYYKKKDKISLISLSVFVSFSCLVRYSGFSLMLWGAFIILLSNRDNLRKLISHLSTFVLISVLPVGIWLIRNYVISNTLTGPRGSSTYTLIQELGFLSDNLIYWYIPREIVDHRLALILLGAIVGFLAGLSPKDIWQSVKSRLCQTTPVGLFIIIYTAFLVITTTVTSLEPISNRYVSPLYVPLTLIFFIFIQSFVDVYRKRFSNKIVGFFLLVGLAIWFVYPVHSTYLEAVNLFRNGLRYSSRAWVDSKTIHYLLENKSLESECTIYTNDPYATYILAHLVVKESPARSPYLSPEMLNNISELRGSWPEENKSCLVWFNMTNRTDLFTFDELQTVASFALINRLEDGSIYSVTKR
jgi:hypothetical protein